MQRGESISSKPQYRIHWNEDEISVKQKGKDEEKKYVIGDEVEAKIVGESMIATNEEEGWKLKPKNWWKWMLKERLKC